MPNKTLHDMIMWTQDFHRDMATHLQQSATQTGDERARLLLGYLAEHEQQLENLVGRFGEKATDTALNTWVSDYMEQFPPSEHDHRSRPYASMSTGEIMTELEEQHNRVIGLFDHLEDFVQGSAQELVGEIVELEKKEMQRIAQSANRLEDI